MRVCAYGCICKQRNNDWLLSHACVYVPVIHLRQSELRKTHCKSSLRPWRTDCLFAPHTRARFWLVAGVDSFSRTAALSLVQRSQCINALIMIRDRFFCNNLKREFLWRDAPLQDVGNVRDCRHGDVFFKRTLLNIDGRSLQWQCFGSVAKPSKSRILCVGLRRQIQPANTEDGCDVGDASSLFMCKNLNTNQSIFFFQRNNEWRKSWNATRGSFTATTFSSKSSEVQKSLFLAQRISRWIRMQQEWLIRLGSKYQKPNQRKLFPKFERLSKNTRLGTR